MVTASSCPLWPSDLTLPPIYRVLSTAGAAACATLVVVLLSWNTGSSSAGEVALAQQGQLGLMTMLSGDPYWDEHNVANASPYQLSTTPSQHWGGMGSEGYGTPQWDNTGWNAHYHPRDGASMDSESMEPWYWRKVSPRPTPFRSFPPLSLACPLSTPHSRPSPELGPRHRARASTTSTPGKPRTAIRCFRRPTAGNRRCSGASSSVRDGRARSGAGGQVHE